MIDLIIYVVNAWNSWTLDTQSGKKAQYDATEQAMTAMLRPGNGRTGIAYELPDQNVSFVFLSLGGVGIRNITHFSTPIYEKS